MVAPVATVRTLMRGLVDYAGLFPPTALEMSDAVAQYDAHRRSDDVWMLGCFVVPEARLPELASEVQRRKLRVADPWPVSAIVGADVRSAAARIREFNDVHRGTMSVEAAELRPLPRELVADALRELPSDVVRYVEVPIESDPLPMLRAVDACGARAKVRTGGVTSDAFPRAAHVVRFIRRCAELNLPFKATAGLHHPLRGDHPLTYAPDAPRETMFGFLGIFVAAALAREGASDEALLDVVRESDPQSFEFGERTIRWRDYTLDLERLAEARASFGISFGSCSFTEPVEGLRALRLL
jgi:hypothetical protein